MNTPSAFAELDFEAVLEAAALAPPPGTFTGPLKPEILTLDEKKSRDRDRLMDCIFTAKTKLIERKGERFTLVYGDGTMSPCFYRITLVDVTSYDIGDDPYLRFECKMKGARTNTFSADICFLTQFAIYEGWTATEPDGEADKKILRNEHGREVGRSCRLKYSGTGIRSFVPDVLAENSKKGLEPVLCKLSKTYGN